MSVMSTQLNSVIKDLQSHPSYALGSSGNLIKGKGIMLFPTTRTEVSSPFGKRVHPVLGGERMHTGIDLPNNEGAPVFATADGVVIVAGLLGGYGNGVIIDHGNKISTLYGHNSKLLVKVGEVVIRGQVISKVGSTGISTGNHLHYEVRVDGAPVNPFEWL